MTNLTAVDWSKLPIPVDDGGARHLCGARVADVELASTDGSPVSLSRLGGRSVVFAYPLTGRPDRALPEGWDTIPGARGCTPQACAYRDLASALRMAGIHSVFGLSTQDTAYQSEARERLHLPFPLLSDRTLAFAKAMQLPTFEVGGAVLLKRLTLVIGNGVIEKVLYPIFPPGQDAADILDWLRGQPR